MMLFKLPFNNIKKSIRDYTIYFFTLVIGVALFYVFNSIETQTAYLELSERQRDIIDILISLLSGLSVFVAMILGLLIVYASRLMIKRRSREFAIYLTLGMGKLRISAILFIETFLIGLVSLAAGIALGIGISQFTSTFAANLFEANMTEYHFVVSLDTIFKTSVYFGIIYTSVMLFTGFMVGKCKLIDLINSEKKTEKMKLKSPVFCVIVFLVSAAMLGYTYYEVTENTYSLSDDKMGIICIMGALATFLLFWSVSGMLLRVIMSSKKVYFSGLNCFTFRQLSGKVNTMVLSMTIICLMLFVTICTLSSAFSMRNCLNININRYCPADYELESSGDEEAVERFIHGNNDEFLSSFSEYTTYTRFEDNSLSIAEYLGDSLDRITKVFPFLDTDEKIPIYGLSDYNSLMKLYGGKELKLDAGTYALLSNYTESIKYYDELLQSGRTVRIGENTLSPMYNECVKSFVQLSVQTMNDGLIVVPDEAVVGCDSVSYYFTGKYKAESKADRIETDKKLMEYQESNAEKSGIEEYMYTTKIELADSATGLGGLVIYIGLYIGLVFLITSGVILALRSLSDSVDSISRYAMLRKIGADEGEISRSLFFQTLLFFALPLLVACFHSIFGMKFAMSYVLQIFGIEGMARSVACSGVIILLIYGGYFLITYFSSRSIIRDKR